MNWIDRQMRVGHMSLFADDFKMCANWATSSIFDDIAHMMSAWGFPYQAVVNMHILLLQVLNNFNCTIHCRSFFVAC